MSLRLNCYVSLRYSPGSSSLFNSRTCVPKFDPVSNDKTSAQTGRRSQETLHLQVFLFALNHSLQVSDIS